MSKRILCVIGFLVLVPVISFAQSLSCPTLTRSLAFGAEGEDVRALQRFLMSEGELLSDSVTGYFGPLTQQAVTRWQIRNFVIASASDPGAGLVGPKTRAAITARCAYRTEESSSSAPNSSVSGGGVAQNIVKQCSASDIPKTPCATFWQGKRGSDGCVTSWYCTVAVTRYLTSASSTIPASPTATSSATSSSSNATTTSISNFFEYWCPSGTGGFGYWSATPCPTSTGGGTYGSSANVQEGTLCAPNGRQEFIACPFMANCPSGGTYLKCENGIWKRF